MHERPEAESSTGSMKELDKQLTDEQWLLIADLFEGVREFKVCRVSSVLGRFRFLCGGCSG